MALKHSKSFACETEAELSEYDLTWTINKASLCLFSNPESCTFETDMGDYWKVKICNAADGLQFALSLTNCYTRSIWVTYEYFLLKSNKLVRLIESDVKLFTNKTYAQLSHCSTSLMTANEALKYKTDPEDALTFVCRIVTTEWKSSKKANSVPKTDYSFTGITVPPCQMRQDFEAILENGLLTDVALLVEGKHLMAHKAILAARSPVFAAMFNTNMVENRQDHVTITDMNYEVVQQMLRFIYTGKAEIGTEMAHRLLAAADKYALMELKAKCERTICDNLTVSAAMETLILADRHSASQLKSCTLQFIQANWAKVLEGGDFKSMIDELYDALNMK